MVFNSILQENTHFDQEEVCEAVTGYEGSVGATQSLIEAAEMSQTIFEELINIDFAEAALNHNIAGVTESTVEALIEAEGEGGQSIGQRIVDAIKKLWSMFTNFVTNVVNTIKTYLARDLKKLVENSTLKSPEELAKITLKKYTKYDFSQFTKRSSLSVPSYENMDKEKITKAQKDLKDKNFTAGLIKSFSGIDAFSIKDFVDRARKAATISQENVKVSEVISDAKEVLTTSGRTLEAIKSQKKAADKTYKEAVSKVKTKRSEVRKHGEYVANDPSGNTTKVKVDNKDTYAAGCACTLSYMKVVHNIEMADIKLMQQLAQKQIAQAKAIFIKATGKKAKEEATNESALVYEEALLEACEYETEVDMDEISQEVSDNGNEEIA
jgi:hypothetical protein